MPHRSVAKTRTKQMPCKYCGELMTVGSNQRKAPNHVECGIKAMVANMKSMQSRSGPEYERWLASMKRFAERG